MESCGSGASSRDGQQQLCRSFASSSGDSAPASECGRRHQGGRQRLSGEEIEILQKAKQEEIDMAGDPEWREQLRRELEAEIDRRVREALDTPPGERHRRTRELARLKAAAQRDRELTLLRSSLANGAAAAASSAGDSPTRYHGNGYQLQSHQQNPSGGSVHFRAVATPFEANILTTAAGAPSSSSSSSAPPMLPGSQIVDDGDDQIVRERFHRGNGHRHRRRVEFEECDEDNELDGEDDELSEGDDDFDYHRSAALPMISSRQLTCLNPQQQMQLRLLHQPTSPHSPNLRRGLEAMRHFGDLSSEERFLLFSNFTRDAFRQALATVGRLPDGSPLVALGDGRYRDQYGILRDRHGPFWPCDFGPCHPAPRHRRLPSPPVEPLLLPMRNPSSEPLVTADSQRTDYTGRWRGTQIVYDSERCPRFYSPPVVSEGLCPSLVFESRFESGNLRQVRRVGMFEYELVLRTDLYTKRHTQWFYFKVQNAQPSVIYKFIIVNLLKPTSLYGEGMRPLCYSEKAAANGSLGWHRAGHHIRYSRNVTRLQSVLLHREMPYYQLEWQMDFPHPDDSNYLAHCYPYTYSDLRDDLLAIQRDDRRRRYVSEEVLCETNAGNSCFLLTITEPTDEASSIDKLGAVVTARVHPGEANSSWMMKGLIEFLTGESQTAAALRRHFVFKLVPMLNPDGVIVGNYRTSLAARDLNRNYRHPRQEAFPTVFHTKAMLERLKAERNVALYCDLHGHSRKPNVFMYGCDSQYRGVDAEQVNSVKLQLNPTGFLNERLLPWLVSRCSPALFSYRGCKFNIRRCKEATGRVVMWRQFGIENSFTMEATFSGTSASSSDSPRHFNTKDLESMGLSLATALWQHKQVKEEPNRQAQVVVDMTFDLVMGLLTSKGSGLPGAAVGLREDPTGASATAASADSYTKLDKGSLVDLLRSSVGKKADQSASGRLASLTPAKVMEQLALESVDDCSSLLKQLEIDRLVESDSSDSDSESDPELPPPPPPPPPRAAPTEQSSKKRKRKSKKRDANGKKRDAKEPEVARKSKKAVENELNADGNDPGPDNKASAAKSGTTSEDSSAGNSRMKIKQFPMFVSKFEGRTNNGIPCFSEERLLERANRKIYSLHSRLNEERGRDIIYSEDIRGLPCPTTLPVPRLSLFSHVEEISRDGHSGLTSLEEIRYRLQHLLASQDVQEEDADQLSDSEEVPAVLSQPQHQPPILMRQQQHFSVVRPMQSLRPARMLQRRRSLTHFGRAAVNPSAPASLSLDQSMAGSSGQQLLMLNQSQAAPVEQPTATQLGQSDGFVAAPNSISRSRTLRLPQLRERNNRLS